VDQVNKYDSARQEVEFEPITIETVDRAVRDWFDRTVDAAVETAASDRAKVQVLFSSGERYAIRRKGIRDQNGVLILPLISVRRTGMDADPTMQALGTQTGNLTISRRIDPKTNQLKNNIQRVTSAGIPIYGPGPGAVYEVASIPFPDRNIFNYELVIQASYTKQMNTIIQKLFRELDIRKTFVAPIENNGRHSENGEELEDRKPFKGGYFVGFFDGTMSDSSNFEEFTDQERIVRYNTTFRVPANLTLDTEGEKPAVKIQKTAYSVGFKESIVSREQFKKMFPDEPE
jgi:hypothetical protein